MPVVQTNGIEFDYDTFGSRQDPALLLIMGLSAQKISWDEAFCRLLADRGMFVIRFDNRDIGRSTRFDSGPAPDLGAALAGDPSSAAYTLPDMADDTAGLMDGLGIDRAHVVGASMGGMIAQCLAIAHPAKVRSLCSIMSTTGNTRVGQPNGEAIGVLLGPPPTTREEAQDRAMVAARVIGSPGFPLDEERVRRMAGEAWDRSHDPAGVARQLVAILASPDRTEALKAVAVPTLVIHGEADPLVAISGGRATAEAIPGARLLALAGMGHDLPPPLWSTVVEAIADNAGRAAAPTVP